MNETLLVIILFMSSIRLTCQDNNKQIKQMEYDCIYTNGEITVTFPGSYLFNKDKRYMRYGYFSTSIEHIRFCKINPQPPEVQQVYSEDGYLCSMYILPAMNEADLQSTITKEFAPKAALSSLSKIEKITAGSNEVLKWRQSMGKSRMDHYLVKGKKFFYLFISSPYGSYGYIEKILARVQIKS